MLYHPEQHYAKPKVWSNSGAIIQDLGDEFWIRINLKWPIEVMFCYK
jgi:hypothetical protein